MVGAGDFGAIDRSAMQNADLAIMFSVGPALIGDQGYIRTVG
jgi:hypothetical protein